MKQLDLFYDYLDPILEAEAEVTPSKTIVEAQMEMAYLVMEQDKSLLHELA